MAETPEQSTPDVAAEVPKIAEERVSPEDVTSSLEAGEFFEARSAEVGAETAGKETLSGLSQAAEARVDTFSHDAARDETALTEALGHLGADPASARANYKEKLGPIIQDAQDMQADVKSLFERLSGELKPTAPEQPSAVPERKTGYDAMSLNDLYDQRDRNARLLEKAQQELTGLSPDDPKSAMAKKKVESYTALDGFINKALDNKFAAAAAKVEGKPAVGGERPVVEAPATEQVAEAVPEATPEPTPEAALEPVPEAAPEPAPEAVPEPVPEASEKVEPPTETKEEVEKQAEKIPMSIAEYLRTSEELIPNLSDTILPQWRDMRSRDVQILRQELDNPGSIAPGSIFDVWIGKPKEWLQDQFDKKSGELKLLDAEIAKRKTEEGVEEPKELEPTPEPIPEVTPETALEIEETGETEEDEESKVEDITDTVDMVMGAPDKVIVKEDSGEKKEEKEKDTLNAEPFTQSLDRLTNNENEQMVGAFRDLKREYERLIQFGGDPTPGKLETILRIFSQDGVQIFTRTEQMLGLVDAIVEKNKAGQDASAQIKELSETMSALERGAASIIRKMNQTLQSIDGTTRDLQNSLGPQETQRLKRRVNESFAFVRRLDSKMRNLKREFIQFKKAATI